MHRTERSTDLQQDFAQKSRPARRGFLGCTGCGCVPWVLLLLIAVLAYPFLQRGLFSPATSVTQPICRQIRFLSSFLEVQDMPASFFLVDRRTDNSWIAVQVWEDEYLWTEFGSMAGSSRDAIALILQEGSLQPWMQDTINSVVRLATGPKIPQVALLSPVLRDCSPADQKALEHIFARDILGTEPTGSRPDAAPRADLSVTAEDTGEGLGQGNVDQKQVKVFLGTVRAEQGANIRSGPGLEHEIVTSVPHGHLIAYIAESEDGEWLNLENGNWILASLVAAPATDNMPLPAEKAGPEIPTPTLEPPVVVRPGSQPTTPPLAVDPDPSADVAALRLQALNHVNHARALEGLSPVFLGDNVAAQSHADEMAQNQYLSHWNLAGLTPDMRYTLAGGEAYGTENVAFIGNVVGPECIPYEPTEWLQSALDSLLESPGHRRNILRPEHTTLHLGISHDCRILTVVQLFEGEYVTYEIAPAIEEGQLVMAGHLHNGATLPRTGPAEGVRITYWPPPHALKRGQLFQAASYCSGQPIASILVPLPAFYTYDSNRASWSHASCLTPYEADPQSGPPETTDQVEERMEAAKQWEATPETYTGLQILPDIWRVGPDSFVVQAHVSWLLAAQGPGVYTIVLWGEVDGSPIPLSQYAIFVE